MENNVKFSHDGKKYEVSAMSEFQLTMYGNLLRDLVGENGSFDNTPNAQLQLAMFFLRWNLTTSIDNQAFNFVTDATPENLDVFSTLIATDNELASKWMNAYKEANLEQTDPNASSEEPLPEE